MIFQIVQHQSKIPSNLVDACVLITDNWDDWFRYSTLFHLIYFSDNGKRLDIGGVKVGQFNMPNTLRTPELPNEFEKLDSNYFSLGQDDSYYVKIKELGEGKRIEILSSLNDIAFDSNLYKDAIEEDVTKISLLRFVNPITVKRQFHRLASGGAHLSHYNFTFISSKNKASNTSLLKLDFEVKPDSNPPTNIHIK
jgi:hypothetical protein